MPTLLIVESPAKAKTIAKYLGAGYLVRASMGHVRDLPKSGLAVDIEHDFAPSYTVLPEKARTVRELSEHVRAADRVLLATDPDREGEAIAWHLTQALRPGRTPVQRVVFHQITRDAVLKAVQQPRPIDMRLVDAQQARRVLDRLVGYQVSPLLWRAVKRGLSAGRVQSVALRLIVEREREILAFIPREYWTLTALVQAIEGNAARRRPFAAKLIKVKGADADIPDETTARRYLTALEGATYRVAEVTQRELQRRPAPPFTTSTLQQEASRKLRLPVKRTMSIAQELYEGVDLGGRTEGLITYMRTDSLTVAPEAQAAAREYIRGRFGADYLPPGSPVYKTKVKNAQEAHEAIRPTDPGREPEAIKAQLTPDQYRLYRLIFQRFIASQMAAAVLDGTTIDVEARTPRTRPDEPAPCLFRATGSVVRFPGFLAIYREGTDDGADDELDDKALPSLRAGEALNLLSLTPEQHFTQPPPRYSEATLVKELEAAGVGRPSTYAAIIATILDREYVVRQERHLVPTELGNVVTDLLVAHLPSVVDVGFTADMEQRFDDIAAGERGWTAVLGDFYGPFAATLRQAEATITPVRLAAEESGELCPTCGQPLLIKSGKFGTFLACAGYPDCRTTRPLVVSTGVRCPRCQQAELVEKKSRQGKAFFGCASWPACDHVEWWRPLPQPCPRCGGHLSEIGRGKRRCIACEGQPPPPRRTRRAPSAETRPTTAGTTPKPAAKTRRPSTRASAKPSMDRPPATPRRTRRRTSE